MSVDMKALAQQLTETAERQGFRIILEPISTHAESPEKAPTSPSEAISAEPMKNPLAASKTDSEVAKAVAKERKSWLTVAQAARMMEVCTKTIRAWVQDGKVESKNEGILMVSTDVLNLKKKADGESMAKPVYCIETKTHFASRSEAARAIGVKPASITYAVREARPIKGLHFCHDSSVV